MFEVRDVRAYSACLQTFRRAHDLARAAFGTSPGMFTVRNGAPGRGQRRVAHPRRRPRAAATTAVRPRRRRRPPLGRWTEGGRRDRPDYPLPTIPGYELYQLAYVATFVADRLAQYRRARTAEARRAAAQDVLAGRTALAAATGGRVDPRGELPRPLDLPTYNAAAGRVDLTSNRRVNIVDLTELGRDGFAVVAMIPEVGPVGARVGTDVLAAAIRDHSTPNLPPTCWRGRSPRCRPARSARTTPAPWTWLRRCADWIRARTGTGRWPGTCAAMGRGWTRRSLSGSPVSTWRRR